MKKIILVILICLFTSSAYALTPVEVFKKYSESVVTIYVQDRDGSKGLGSGFFVDKDGLILTNSHVISNAKDVFVKLKNGDVWPMLQLIAQDPGADMALIKIHASGVPISIAKRLPDVGSKVMVIGAPLGFSHTMSDGMLSSVNRGKDGEYIQITAPISHGSSGSPIFDEKGNTIGIATISIEGGQNLNFAPSAASIRDFLHKRPMIKATISEVDFLKLCKEGSIQLIVDAVENGANVNAGIEYGATPLAAAIMFNPNPEVIVSLIQAGTDVNARDKEGITPLMLAAIFGKSNSAVISAFTKAGANVNVKDNFGWTPLMQMVARNSNPTAITAIIRAGADVNAKNEEGNTPLMLAAMMNTNPGVITTLLQSGANPKVKNTYGHSAIDYAKVNGKLRSTEVLRILERESR